MPLIQQLQELEEPTTSAANLHSKARHSATSGDFGYSSSHTLTPFSTPRALHTLGRDTIATPDGRRGDSAGT
jgi:hypothetical protein